MNEHDMPPWMRAEREVERKLAEVRRDLRDALDGNKPFHDDPFRADPLAPVEAPDNDEADRQDAMFAPLHVADCYNG